MKMYKRSQKVFIGILLVVVVIISGCSKAYSNENNIRDDNTGMEMQEYDNKSTEDRIENLEYGESYVETEEGLDDSIHNTSAVGGISQFSYNNKIIKNYDLSLEALEFDHLINGIELNLTTLGGYVQSSNIGGNSYHSYNRKTYRHASIVARVPKDKVNNFINNISKEANVISRSEASEDVTLNYVDVESRKKSLEIQQERILNLLGKSEDLSDILTLEERLNSLRYDIERLGSTLRTYDNLVDFSTVSLEIQEVEKITEIKEKKELTSFERMKEGLLHSINIIKTGMIDFAIEFIIILPFLLIWGIIILIIVLVLRKVIKKANRDNRKKKEVINIPTTNNDFVDNNMNKHEEQ